jgi:hypothetical protein
MVKRKTQPQKIPNEPAVQAEHYQIGVWAGIPQYRCTLCAFDMLEKPAMLAHLYDAHGLQVEGYRPTAPEPTTATTPEAETQSNEEVFEVELKEVSETVDDEGNVHKQYTIKDE